MTTLALTKPHASRRFTEAMVILVAVLGTGMLNLDTNAINVALPTIQVALGIDIAGMQWIIDSFILTMATLLLIGGILGDRYGRVRVVIIGALIFSLASLASGMAQSLGFLLTMRAIQGVGGALLAPSGLALINATIPPERKGQMIGLWATLVTVVIAMGPLLGGWLVDHVSWRAIFLLNVPLGLGACYFAFRYVPESRDEGATGPLDWPGVVTLIIGLGGLLFGVIEGPRLGWQHPLVVAMIIGSVVGFIAFVIIEQRSTNPMLPLQLFHNRAFTGINLLTTLYFMTFTGTIFFLSLNLLQVQGFSAFNVGLAFLPVTTAVFLLSTPMGRLADRIGTRLPLLAALVVTGISYLMLARLGLESNYWLSFFPATIILGLGIGIIVVPMTIIPLTALPDRYSGFASGASYASTRIGNMLAIAIFGALMVITFQISLADRVSELALSATAQTELLAQARNVGATLPPANLSPELSQATQTAIHLAFVDSFQQIMIVCAGLMVVGMVIVLVFHRKG